MSTSSFAAATGNAAVLAEAGERFEDLAVRRAEERAAASQEEELASCVFLD
jgi:hypothetical protein